MTELLTNLSKVLPQLVLIALVFGFIGWKLRGRGAKSAPAKASKPTASGEKAQGQDRAKNLEAALEKSRSSHKALKTEFDQLKGGSVSQEIFEKTTADLDAARKQLETESRRASALEVDVKKAQETNKLLNSRANEVDKTQKDRGFTLENELSKVREQLALLQDRPDDTAVLHAEIERLRESVATTTRYAGELRKREAAAIEALEKAEVRHANAVESGRDLPVTSKKIGPVKESNRIAAAKAEVLRLIEQNKQKAAPIEESSAPVEEVIASVEEVIAPVEEVIAPVEEVIVPEEEIIAPVEEVIAPVEEVIASEASSSAPAKKPLATGDLFAVE